MHAIAKILPLAGLLTGCAAAAPTADVPVQTRALETAVSLGLGQRDFTMTLTRADGTTSDKIRCLNFSYNVVSPRDAATGQASGKRQHKPITIVKEWDAASPLLMKALVANEEIRAVKFEFSRNKVDSPNFFDVFTEITLSNASIVELTHTVGEASTRCPDGACVVEGGSNPRELEECAIVCQKATMTNLDGKTTAEDTWVTQH
jgi:type VI secretion system secreted protein Hcp